ncbi:hypothetical protein EDC30_1058 [Paucimonas lemoignei]|uniref:Uncharacterized protein n=1 Tax=Paucimonas lemoignei TaxID=29443 RepID=A0A4R3HZ55_PAULE|nr:hypothetical protein EDC30_1058 [Paucimonas lemoignei]
MFVKNEGLFGNRLLTARYNYQMQEYSYYLEFVFCGRIGTV